MPVSFFSGIMQFAKHALRTINIPIYCVLDLLIHATMHLTVRVCNFIHIYICACSGASLNMCLLTALNNIQCVAIPSV